MNTWQDTENRSSRIELYNALLWLGYDWSTIVRWDHGRAIGFYLACRLKLTEYGNFFIAFRLHIDDKAGLLVALVPSHEEYLVAWSLHDGWQDKFHGKPIKIIRSWQGYGLPSRLADFQTFYWVSMIVLSSGPSTKNIHCPLAEATAGMVKATNF